MGMSQRKVHRSREFVAVRRRRKIVVVRWTRKCSVLRESSSVHCRAGLSTGGPPFFLSLLPYLQFVLLPRLTARKFLNIEFATRRASNWPTDGHTYKLNKSYMIQHTYILHTTSK